MHPSQRTYHDPLHGAITLSQTDPTEALLIQLIDTPAFQRLRRIRQLGPASLTFHGAEGSRFTHSLGVMAVARRIFDPIADRHPQLHPYRPLVLCAALLHDIGHGPFSHTAEDIFKTGHEQWTQRILQEFQPIHSLLQQFHPELCDQLQQVYRKRFPLPFVWQLVSSQLDCDRLDYLMRDSYFTGASYGKLDLDRIILALGYDPVTQQLVVAKKGIAAIEHYLIVRYFMYLQVYNHPKNLAATWVLEHAFARARVLLAQNDHNLWMDQTVQAWLLHPDQLTLSDYLAADDTVFLYHLQQWRSHPDPVLADLCRRFLDRDLLKTLDVTDWSEAERQNHLILTRQYLTSAGWDAAYYLGLRVCLNRGYTLYQRGIYLQTPQGLQDITELSPLVQTLTRPVKRTWLIYPRELATLIGQG
jgi:hypothetical protein